MMYTDQMRIDPAYRAALRDCGLLRVNDILERIEGRVHAWSRTTDTLYVPSPGGGPGFFVKRYYYPKWRNRIRGTFRGTFFGLHRGQAEDRSLNRMRRLGIPGVRPVAYGSRRLFHFVAACFLITEEAPGSVNLTSFAREVQTGRRRLTHERRLALVDRLAEQIAAMHAAGFAHGQMFWRNVVVRDGPDGEPEFFFLDAYPPRRLLGRRPPGRWWVRELAPVAASALPFVSRTERLRFVLRYFGAARLTPEIKADAREIDKLAARSRKHETQRIKMNDLFEEWNRQLISESGNSPEPAALPETSGAGALRPGPAP